MAGLKLIVGLGNPSPEYDHTRHNVGALWLRGLARRYAIPLNLDTKFKAEVGHGLIAGENVRLAVPTTYMNLSGEAVGAITRFYKINTEEVLIAYDEMAFEPGLVRLKQGGGDNGHNGIKSVRSGCGNDANFHRLRIGVGHPGDRSRVTAYLTQIKMPAGERQLVDASTDLSEPMMQALVRGEWQTVMNDLHRTPD